MRRLAILVPFVLACSGGSLTSKEAASQLTAALGDAGVKCLHREPPPFHACDGLDAGASCAVPDDDSDGGRAGSCKGLRDGRLVCAGADDDDDHADGGEGDHQRDGGGDDEDREDGGGRHQGADGGMDGMHDGGAEWMRDGGLPPPIQAALDACVGHAADDVCSVSFREHAVQGACRLAPDGKTLICAPLCFHR
jgi:hypothetical protein